MSLRIASAQDVDAESLLRFLVAVTGREAADAKPCVEFQHWATADLADGVTVASGAYLAHAASRMSFVLPPSVHVFARLTGESASGFDGEPTHHSAVPEVQVWRLPAGGLKLVDQPPARPTRFLSFVIALPAFAALTGDTEQGEETSGPEAHPLPPGVREAMRAYFESHLEPPARELYRRGKALEILALLAQAMRCEPAAPTALPCLRSDDVARIRAVAEWMGADPAAAWSLHGLARDAGVNVNKLKAGFRALHGVSVFAWLRDRRLEMALQYLTETDLGVAQIAYRVGFSSPSHFTQLFHTRFAAPPLAYRRARAANAADTERLSA